MAQGKIISSTFPAPSTPPDASNIVISNVNCDSTVYVGSAVRMNELGYAVNALADSISNSNVLGIVESKQSSTKCTVRVSGVSSAIYSSLDVTKEYYLHDTTDGLISTFIPTDTGHIRLRIGQPYSSTQLVVLKGERVIRG